MLPEPGCLRAARIDWLTSGNPAHKIVDNRCCQCCQCCDDFLYYFKGARSAPGPGWASLLSRAPREDDADPDAAQLPPVAGRAVWGTLRAWAPPAALSPDGHGGVGARAVPATRRTGRAPQRSALGGAGCKSGPSSRRSSMKPGKITYKGASRHA